MTELIVTPTYNEAAGIAAFVDRFERAAPSFQLLVVDDASPDGTGAIVEELRHTRPWLHVLHRTGKDGLGAAYRAGFAWALERGYTVVGQMDADGQHPPEALAVLRARLVDADLVVGSRYVDGGTTEGWDTHRLLMSRAAGRASRAIVDLPYRDLSGGFKLWRADALRAIDVCSTRSQGYVFQIETTLRAERAGLRIVEEAFAFGAREHGTSKLSARVGIEGARVLLDLRRDPWRPALSA
jgi:dolichol-phosphate mannosyltransferase